MSDIESKRPIKRVVIGERETARREAQRQGSPGKLPENKPYPADQTQGRQRLSWVEQDPPLRGPPPILCPRSASGVMLGGASISTVIRLELEGKLTPIRLTNGKTGKVYHRIAQVRALANTDGNERIEDE